MLDNVPVSYTHLGMTFNDKDPKEWDEEFWNYVDSLHDEIPVTVVWTGTSR